MLTFSKASKKKVIFFVQTTHKEEEEEEEESVSSKNNKLLLQRERRSGCGIQRAKLFVSFHKKSLSLSLFSMMLALGKKL